MQKEKCNLRVQWTEDISIQKLNKAREKGLRGIRSNEIDLREGAKLRSI